MKYEKLDVLTSAEQRLYHLMVNNLVQKDKIVIFPKVRLADIIKIKGSNYPKHELYKIAYKHVDFLICNKNTLDTICVVELDDYTHASAEAKEHDEFIMSALYSAGINVIRIKKRIRYVRVADFRELELEISKALAPRCPYCGAVMVPKECSTGIYKGHRFYGCINFNKGCKASIDIDEVGEKLP